jgi:hypothetical protein
MPKKPTKPATKKDQAKVQGEGREVIYPEIRAEVHDEKNPITVELAKSILGWTEEVEGETFKKGTFVDELEPFISKRVRLINNVTNRPLYLQNIQNLRQEILNKRWRINGEPIIVGRTGLVLNGQHTLLSLILAEHELTKGDDKEHWETLWPSECTIDKIIVYGIEETDNVVNTMDTCKPRTLSDVIYRTDFFKGKDLTGGQRRQLAKITEHAIRLLWDRTGAGLDAFSPRRTHAECLAYLENHKKVLDCVKHVWQEDGDKEAIGRSITLGYASAIMYLMAASNTIGETYRELTTPNESGVNFDNLDKAKSFWVEFSMDSTKIKDDFKWLKKDIAALADPDTGKTGSLQEKLCLFSKAWACWLAETPMDEAALKLEYKSKQDGGLKLLDKADFGGIDITGADLGSDDDDEPDLTPEEIAANAKAEREAKQQGKKEANTPVNMLIDYWKGVKEKSGGKFLLLASKNADMWRAYEDDAEILAQVMSLKGPKKRPDGMRVLEFPNADLPVTLALLRPKCPNGIVKVFDDGNGGETLEDVSKPAAAKVPVPPTPAATKPSSTKPTGKKGGTKETQPKLQGGC